MSLLNRISHQLVFPGISLLAVSVIPANTQPAAEIIFSELMWMGSSASSADEWIELTNMGDEPVDLTGWTITRLSADGESEMVRLEGVVGAGEAFLVANYSPDDVRSRLAATPNMVTTAVSLPNSKLQLKLYDGASDSAGVLIDVADDGRGSPFAGANKKKASMVRVEPEVAGFEKRAWGTATTASGWDQGGEELGNPRSARGANSTTRGKIAQ